LNFYHHRRPVCPSAAIDFYRFSILSLIYGFGSLFNYLRNLSSDSPFRACPTFQLFIWTRCLVFLIYINIITASTLYVSPTGTSTDCSRSSPCAFPTALRRRLDITALPGIYHVRNWADPFALISTPSINITSEAPHSAVLDFSLITDHAIVLSQNSKVNISGFKIVNFITTFGLGSYVKSQVQNPWLNFRFPFPGAFGCNYDYSVAVFAVCGGSTLILEDIVIDGINIYNGELIDVAQDSALVARGVSFFNVSAQPIPTNVVRRYQRAMIRVVDNSTVNLQSIYVSDFQNSTRLYSHEDYMSIYVKESSILVSNSHMWSIPAKKLEKWQTTVERSSVVFENVQFVGFDWLGYLGGSNLTATNCTFEVARTTVFQSTLELVNSSVNLGPRSGLSQLATNDGVIKLRDSTITAQEGRIDLATNTRLAVQGKSSIRCVVPPSFVPASNCRIQFGSGSLIDSGELPVFYLEAPEGMINYLKPGLAMYGMNITDLNFKAPLVQSISGRIEIDTQVYIVTSTIAPYTMLSAGGGAGLIHALAGSEVSIQGMSFLSNTIIDTLPSLSASLITLRDNSSLLMTSSAFTNNTVAGAVPLIDAKDSSVSITNNNFTNNSGCILKVVSPTSAIRLNSSNFVANRGQFSLASLETGLSGPTLENLSFSLNTNYSSIIFLSMTSSASSSWAVGENLLFNQNSLIGAQKKILRLFVFVCIFLTAYVYIIKTGAQLVLNGGKVKLERLVITWNSIFSSGGLVHSNDVDLVIDSALIENNSILSPHSCGGLLRILRMNSSPIVISNSHISNNSVDFGGVVCFDKLNPCTTSNQPLPSVSFSNNRISIPLHVQAGGVVFYNDRGSSQSSLPSCGPLFDPLAFSISSPDFTSSASTRGPLRASSAYRLLPSSKYLQLANDSSTQLVVFLVDYWNQLVVAPYDCQNISICTTVIDPPGINITSDDKLSCGSEIASVTIKAQPIIEGTNIEFSLDTACGAVVLPEPNITIRVTASSPPPSTNRNLPQLTKIKWNRNSIPVQILVKSA